MATNGGVRTGIRRVVGGVVPTAQSFVQTEASSGVVLLAAVALALLWANSPWSNSYFDLWHHAIAIDLGPIERDTDPQHLVNDGLMAIFFFVVGLEIKREFLEGELRQPAQAILPVAGAVGGMVLPALIYLSLNLGSEGEHGWGIPMATDIAMAVGVLALLGSRIPPAARVFLLALAIVDDLGAIAVIAIVYTNDVALGWLGLAVVALAAIVIARVLRVRALLLYAVLALLLWLEVWQSGVHATVAGVALAMLVPVEGPSGARTLDNVEEALHPWSSFLIVPLFALANAGVDVGGGIVGDALTSSVAYGIVAGLVLGKFLGIGLASWAVTRFTTATLPEGATWPLMTGIALVAGVGFTVSLFVSGLAFDSQQLQDEAKIGILAASTVAGGGGYLWLRAVTSRRRATPHSPATRAG